MFIKTFILCLFFIPTVLLSQIQVSVGTGVTYHHIGKDYLIPGNQVDLTFSGEVSYTIANKYIISSEYRYLQLEREYVATGGFSGPSYGIGLTLHNLSLGIGLKVTNWLSFKTGYYRCIGSKFEHISTIDPYYSTVTKFNCQGSQVSLVYTSPIKLSLEFVVNLMLVGDVARVDHMSTYSLLVKAPLIWRKDKS